MKVIIFSVQFVFGLLFFSGGFVQTVLAADSDTGAADRSSSERPKIGLALSGGGARGAAHLGVLQVLEEMHIPVDYIAGTSMGSIIGGLYASGMSPEEIEKAYQSLEWETIFADKQPRQQRSFRRKRDDDLYVGSAKLGISDDFELKLPTGAIQGQKFDLALRNLTMSASGVSDFDQLHIPFRAVATAIGSGQKVVLGSGDLAAALRASMAVPSVFAASQIDGVLLVDGGISDNLPIDVVRSMGADIIIAIDIGSPNLPEEELTNIFAITGQLTNIMTRSNVEQQIATLGDRDILIVPELGDLTSGDFLRSSDAIKAGRKGAEALRTSLAKLSIPEDLYKQLIAARTPRPNASVPTIKFTKIANDSGVDDSLIQDRLQQQTDSPLDRAQLEQNIGDIYGLELFQNVRYELIKEDQDTGLLVDVRARSWGPNYLQLGMELASDIDGNSSYNLGLAYQRTAINSMNGELRAVAQWGENPLLGAEWHQPLDSLSKYFISMDTRYGARQLGQFTSDGSNKLAEFRIIESKSGLSVGREFGVYGEIRLGYRYRNGEVKQSTGQSGVADFNYDTGQVYGRLSVDRLDNFSFPDSGWSAAIEYASARPDFGSDNHFDQGTIYSGIFETFGNGHVFSLNASISSTLDGQAPVQDQYREGGFLKLSGFAEDSLVGQQSGVVSALYYSRFAPLPILSWYIGASLEYGGVWQDKSDLFNDGLNAQSIFLGADTPLGPVYIGYGHADGGNHSIFFYLGKPQFR